MSDPSIALDYWVLRLVPDTVREEFINIGVIVGAGDAWAVAALPDVRHPDLPDAAVEAVMRWLARLDAMTRGEDSESLSHSWIEHLRQRQSNNLQLAGPRRVAAESADAAARTLFDLYVPAERARAAIARIR